MTAAETVRSLLVIALAMLAVGGLVGATGMWLWLNRDRDAESIRRAERARAAQLRLARRNVHPGRSGTRWL